MSLIHPLSDRVNVVGVAVEAYDYLERLHGPLADLAAIRKLLCDDNETATIPSKRAEWLSNPDSNTLRKCLLEYVLARSAENDILIFYFSGHAIRLGTGDLGICTVDTAFHPGFSTVSPLGLVRVRDIIESISAAHVDPVIIVDACYSGEAGRSIQESYDQLKKLIQAETGSAYALLCSSRAGETAGTLFDGGVFTDALSKAAKTASADTALKRKAWLSLADLFPYLRKQLETAHSSGSQLYLGETLPAFPFVKNQNFEPRTERFSPSHKAALEVFRTLGRDNYLESNDLFKCGQTIYTTHSKLGYGPAWGLLERKGKFKRLSERGRAFVDGKIKIPVVIEQNELTQEWYPAEGTPEISYEEITMP